MVVDAGNALLPPSDPVDPQRVIKAELIAEGFALGGIDAMAIGQTDWRLGREQVLALVTRHKLPALAANLTCEGAAPLPASRVVERGGRRIGFVGFTEGPVEGCEVLPVRVSAERAVAALGPVDVTIALAATSPAHFGLLAGLFDFVVDGGSGRSYSTPAREDEVWTLSPGARGKYLGVASLSFVGERTGWTVEGYESTIDQKVAMIDHRLARLREKLARPDRVGDIDERQRAQVVQQEEQKRELEAERQALLASLSEANILRNTTLPLSEAVADHPPTAALLKGALERISAAEGMPTEVTAQRLAPEGSLYAGSHTCAGCHPMQDTQWRGTAHAKAWASLVTDGRAADAECFACHATGVGAGGPTRPAEVGGLRDVQCEACHGAARAHVLAPADAKPAHRDPPLATCIGCHDGMRDDGRFDAASYLPRVRHGVAP